MAKISKLLILILLIRLSIISLYAQEGDKNNFYLNNIVVPSLTISPDARAGGMGDNGVSTTSDIASQYWNPAKYAFHESKAGVGLSYTPWLRKLVNDVALAYASGFYKIGDGDNQAIGASVRYFSLGEMRSSTIENPDLEYYIQPYDMALDVSYSRKLSQTYSMAVGLRYIRSDMSDDTRDLTAGSSFAADIAGYMQKYVMLGRNECLWTLGFNATNVGTKMTFDDGITYNFLPTTLRVGTGLKYPLDDYNTISIHADFSKYMVPNGEESNAEYNKMSFVKGIVKSFYDSPGGLSGELKEIMTSLGAEYCYDNQFFLRSGYFFENNLIGNRRYFTAGVGFKMNVFQLDAAYLISTVPNNPLDQTLRFSLSFDMDGLKNLLR